MHTEQSGDAVIARLIQKNMQPQRRGITRLIAPMCWQDRKNIKRATGTE